MGPRADYEPVCGVPVLLRCGQSGELVLEKGEIFEGGRAVCVDEQDPRTRGVEDTLCAIKSGNRSGL